jgi:deoxyhypusine synthase
MCKIERTILKYWRRAKERGERFFPHEFFYQALLEGVLRNDYQADAANSWLLAAAERNIPIVVPGWEDSTLGNAFAAHCITGKLVASTVKSGIEYMVSLADWYVANCNAKGMGFLQIGGGIAGDFPICVVPMLTRDLRRTDVPLWSYFCQISDSTTSYGSYSGAIPNEKISWGKLGPDTPRYVIESDATIVAPLIFAWVLGF